MNFFNKILVNTGSSTDWTVKKAQSVPWTWIQWLPAWFADWIDNNDITNWTIQTSAAINPSPQLWTPLFARTLVFDDNSSNSSRNWTFLWWNDVIRYEIYNSWKYNHISLATKSQHYSQCSINKTSIFDIWWISLSDSQRINCWRFICWYFTQKEPIFSMITNACGEGVSECNNSKAYIWWNCLSN